jgi:ribbon-helix-helix CopG family protein
MVRLQIQLDAAQHRRVRRRAQRLGVSVSEVIRRCVDAGLSEETADAADAIRRRALAAVGRYADPAGSRTIAADHDRALADAFKK